MSDPALMFFDGRADDNVEHRKLLDDPELLASRRDAFPDGPVRLAQLDGAPADLRSGPGGAGARPRRRSAADRVSHGRKRSRAVDGAGGYGFGDTARLAVHGVTDNSDDVLRIHELHPPLPPREIFLLWQAGRTHSPLATQAIEIAVDVAGGLAKRS